MPVRASTTARPPAAVRSYTLFGPQHAGRVEDRRLPDQKGHTPLATPQRYIQAAKRNQAKAYDVDMPEILKKNLAG